ncbi:MAG: sensor histidine kinase [Phaeodactylibacter sp.]|nr:sensor histidine kinase [Phaeodactylibacter sp.]
MNSTNNKRYVILLHLLDRASLLGFPYLLSGQSMELGMLLKRNWIPMGMYALLFYTNYLWVVPTYLFKNKRFYFVLINLVLVGLLIVFKQEVVAELFRESPPPGSGNPGAPPMPPRGLFVYIDMLSLIVPIMFAVALSMADRWKRAEAVRQQAETERLQSELKHLKYQLQPHFFFNSLNNIYAMVDLTPEKAKKAIHDLSKLMRYFLYEANDGLVPLTKEVEFLQKYIDLMKLRHSEKTEVSTKFAEDIPDLKVAPLLFIAAVENAFKHGISATKPSKITFGLSITPEQIEFTSLNKNFPKTEEDKSGSGIGLENLKKRLELIYPNAHQFSTHIDENDFYHLSLIIKIS